MNTLKNKFDDFLNAFGKGKKMVLSTSENNQVSSRMMSVIQMNGIFYFQTDRMLRKYRQLISNPKVALCIDNIQIEGICKEIGHPMEQESFCKLYQECYQKSYERYTSLKNERLFAVTPTHLERWIYHEGLPFLETFDFEKNQYELKRYDGGAF